MTVPLMTGLIDHTIEQAYLAAVLTDNSVALRPGLEHLRAEHFADPLHGRIFDTAVTMIRAGERVDDLTLRPHFLADPALKPGGAATYLSDLRRCVVLTEGAEDYGRRIHELSQRRRLRQLAHDLSSAAGEFDTSSDEIVGRAVSELNGIVRDGPQFATDKADIRERVVDEMLNPPPCFSTGLPSLDRALGGGLYAGHLVGVAARMKIGKTVLLGTISQALQSARAPHLIISLEMGATELERRSLARELGVNAVEFLRRDYTLQGLCERTANAAVNTERGITFYHDAPGGTLDSVVQSVLSAKLRNNITGVIIDYWQLIRGQARGQSLEEHLSAVAQDLASLARRERIWVLMAAQLNQTGNVRSSEGLKLACDALFMLKRDDTEGGDALHYWMEGELSRHTMVQNIGSAPPGPPGLSLHMNGPWFEDITPIPPSRFGDR